MPGNVRPEGSFTRHTFDDAIDSQDARGAIHDPFVRCWRWGEVSAKN